LNKESIFLNTYVNQSAEKYIDFMDIEKLPQFRIIEKKVSLSDANEKGFGSFASHHYDIPTGTHSLFVWSDMYQPQLHAEYLLFHEFTHILDIEMYAQKDKMKNVKYKGFSEYHAGQIDFLKVLGVEKADASFSFSMKQIFETVAGPKTAEELVIEAHNASTSLINRSNFPADVETLVITFGLFFNYWGRRSICKMHAVDYVEKVDNEVIEKCMGKEPFKAMDVFMNGWLAEDQIKLIGEFYFKMIASKMEGLTALKMGLRTQVLLPITHKKKLILFVIG